MTDPVKEAVALLHQWVAIGDTELWGLGDRIAIYKAVRSILASHSRLEAENARLVKLVEEAGEALDLIERKAESAVRELTGGHPFNATACLDEIDTIAFAAAQATWEGRPPKPTRRRASLTHKTTKDAQ